jgi:RHS repeat-associated protein
MRRGPSGDPVMEADYTYYVNGLIESVTYGNAAGTLYESDDANRLTVIEHDDGSAVLLRLAYTYTANSLPDTITETDDVSTFAIVDFDYDARGRLIHEDRDDGENSRDYDLTYTYDQSGNRLKKIDAINDVEVQYHYDLEDPERYVSKNNRVVYFETLDTEPDPPVVASTTWYYYSILGNPTWIVTKQSGSDDYSATRFGYAKNGETVTLVLGETWTWDGQSGCETSQTYDITFAREFRYDSGRARYLDRQLDPEDLEGGVYTALSETWSDYDGDEIYGDYTVGTGGAVSNARSFEPGHGMIDPWTNEGDDSTTYVHSDHLGTLREASGDAGASLRVFTAFGEPITSQADRYGFVGAWGYRVDEDLPYLHVGDRYYDSQAGRFLQRDPLGVAGGLNAYAYADNQPTVGIDPTGLDPYPDPVDEDQDPVVHPSPSPSPGPGGGGDGGGGGAKKSKNKKAKGHRKQRPSTYDKHTKAGGHSSTKDSKAKARLKRLGKWRFRIRIPVFVTPRCWKCGKSILLNCGHGI